MNKIFKQYNIKGIGTFINVLYLTSPLVGVMMALINATTFYAVVNKYIHDSVPWLSFPIFLVLLILGLLVLIFLFYILVYAGYQAFSNQQVYKHDNPIRTDLEKLKSNQMKIMEHLGIKNDEE